MKIQVDLEAIAIATSPLERTSILAFLATANQSYTLTELTEEVPKFVVNQGGAEHSIELSTGKASWLIATLIAAKLVEVNDKKYSATVVGRYVYTSIIEDAYQNALRPEADPVLAKIASQTSAEKRN